MALPCEKLLYVYNSYFSVDIQKLGTYTKCERVSQAALLIMDYQKGILVS